MKKLEEKEIEKLLKSTLSHQAPVGMVDRIMAHVTVLPHRRVSIKPLEPNPVFALAITLAIIVVLIMAFIFKPDAWASLPWSKFPDFNISTLWIAPIVIVSITVWGYIALNEFEKPIKRLR